MKFTLDVATSLPILNQALKTCNTKADDSDASFLIAEKDNGLWITSINEKAEQINKLPILDLEADSGESFFVSGQAFVEFIRQFPDDEAECECDGASLTIKGTVKDINYSFPVSGTENYAPRNYVSTTLPIECDAQAFAEALKLTSFSCSLDKSDGVTVGLRVQLFGDKLITQSTDLDRISMCEIDIEDIGLTSVSFILPKSIAETLSSILDDAVVVKIEKGRNHIRFQWNDTTLTSELIDDSNNEFPDVIEHMEGNIEAEIVVSRADLIGALKIAGLVAKDSWIKINASNEGLRISISDKHKGAGTNLIDAQKVTGKNETYCTLKNILQGVSMTTSPWITLEFRALSFSPNFGIGIIDDDFRHFIFPIIPKDEDDD
jgi:DNA polymerase III sliding clamp (beta) subunit (PCNA family)